MKNWLLLHTELERIQALESSFLLNPIGDLKVTSSAFPMTVSHGSATIQIKGPLVKERDAILDFFGVEHTAYSEIKAQVAEAKAKGAKRGTMFIDSPGGEVSGLTSTMDAIAASGISWRAVTDDVLASAAYMLASQCKGGIYATDETATVGSIGVATSAYVSDRVKHIANTDSAKKRPDVATDDGVAVVREELDDFWGIIEGKIASGRGVTVDKIKENYGQGAAMTARTAKQKGIIDGIEKPSKPAAKQAAVRGESMTLEELKAQYPEVYKAAAEEAKTAERRRVQAHLTLADASGDMESAKADILSGSDIDASVQAKHIAAGMKRAAVSARQEETIPSVDGGTKPATGMGGKSESAASVKAELLAKYPKVKTIEVRGGIQ